MPSIARLVCLVCVGWFLYAAPCFADQTRAVKFTQAAIALRNPNVVYDGSYHRIAYPLGDVPTNTGVCADVVVRAYRVIGIDLQKLVHEDMLRHFSAYPARWSVKHADSNIDHRRVPNLMTFFKRHGKVLKITHDPRDYHPGDVVTWNLIPGGFLPHIGIVTDRKAFFSPNPLIMHNIGGGQVLEDKLFDYQITGHYRYGLD
jgi:uncharacterized protein YijF (DUF1287 family)